MATTKTNTTKKAPRKTAPKKQHEPIEKKPEHGIEQLELPNKPEPMKEEEKVSYVIPRDNSLESGDQYFEWCCNGINYRFKRGEVLTHPRSLYEAISKKLFARERVSPFVAEFRNTSKKLN